MPCLSLLAQEDQEVRDALSTIRAWKQKKSENNIPKNIFLDCYRSDDYEVFCLLGYNAMLFVESHLTFQRNMSPLSSGSEKEPSKKM
jgi:hypothetical protein